MNQVKIMVFSKNKIKKGLILSVGSLLLIYLLISLFFLNHFYFRTEINGVDVSLQPYKQTTNEIRNFIEGYQLVLIGRNSEIAVIKGANINMQLNQNSVATSARQLQNPFLWVASIFKKHTYNIKGLYSYNNDSLNLCIEELNCFNRKMVDPQNVSFKYNDGFYSTVKENYGNKINKERFSKIVKIYIASGKTKLNLEQMLCYETPKYTIVSNKTQRTRSTLNRYVATRITYQFGKNTEILNGDIINKWLSVDENLNIIIHKDSVEDYVKQLSKIYNTVGMKRTFQTSTGKNVTIEGGLYGWKIDIAGETDTLIKNIKKSLIIKREPIYTQKALSREGNEIGTTYIEINITKQHLWFYKNGKLFIQGYVVTGNPNRGYATVLGVNFINYKQKDANLTGPGYDAKVTYWMPFYGNMGLHDASWRYSFGGEIYKRNGSHGCVNAPSYLAKKIFENIEPGTPVITYEE